MTQYNLKHIAKAYSDKDLDTLIEECEDIAARLSNLVCYLERDNGTIADYLSETSIELGKLAQAAYLSSELKHGNRVFKLSNGEWVSERTVEVEVDYYHNDRGFSFVDAIDRVFVNHGWSFQDRVAMGWG